MGVVLGIMFTQIAGFGLATPKLWRLVLLVSSGLAIFQIMYSPFVCESPVWLRMKGRSNEVDAIHAVLYAGLPPREGPSFFYCIVVDNSHNHVQTTLRILFLHLHSAMTTSLLRPLHLEPRRQ
jgi:hypothetical protein